MKPNREQIKQTIPVIHAIFAKLGFNWAYGNSSARTMKDFCHSNGLIYIGIGCTRVVVAHPDVPGVVFKIVTKDWYGASDVADVNRSEKAMWERLRKTKLRKYFARVWDISDDGYVLCMDHVQGVRVKNISELEDKVRVRNWQDVSDKMVREFYSIDVRAWREYQISIRDLHEENVLVEPIANGKRVRLKAVDYGGASFN